MEITLNEQQVSILKENLLAQIGLNNYDNTTTMVLEQIINLLNEN